MTLKIKEPSHHAILWCFAVDQISFFPRCSLPRFQLLAFTDNIPSDRSPSSVTHSATNRVSTKDNNLRGRAPTQRRLEVRNACQLWGLLSDKMLVSATASEHFSMEKRSSECCLCGCLCVDYCIRKVLSQEKGLGGHGGAPLHARLQQAMAADAWQEVNRRHVSSSPDLLEKKSTWILT